MLTDDKRPRCSWATRDALERDYHDAEWGVPVRDGRMLWEMLMLEGFQAGLSWLSVLRKRQGFSKAFASFDPAIVATFTSDDVERLVKDEGIIRARAKIEATIAGAKLFNAMAARGEPFADYCWSFVDGKPLQGDGHTVVAQSELSARISKDLKKRGFKFVGPTIVYAWMQGVGVINDHSERCFRREPCARLG